MQPEENGRRGTNQQYNTQSFCELHGLLPRQRAQRTKTRRSADTGQRHQLSQTFLPPLFLLLFRTLFFCWSFVWTKAEWTSHKPNKSTDRRRLPSLHTSLFNSLFPFFLSSSLTPLSDSFVWPDDHPNRTSQFYTKAKPPPPRKTTAAKILRGHGDAEGVLLSFSSLSFSSGSQSFQSKISRTTCAPRPPCPSPCAPRGGPTSAGTPPCSSAANRQSTPCACAPLARTP